LDAGEEEAAFWMRGDRRSGVMDASTRQWGLLDVDEEDGVASLGDAVE